MKAVLRRTRIAPKKANLVAGMVRGKKIKEALDILRFTPKKAAKILYKVVNSAAHNAKNNFKQSINDLVITKIIVTKGPMYKRTMPVSRGRSHPILKRTCHIFVEVGIPEVEKSKTKEVETEKTEPIMETSEKPKKIRVKKAPAKKTEETKETPHKEVKAKSKKKKESTNK